MVVVVVDDGMSSVDAELAADVFAMVLLVVSAGGSVVGLSWPVVEAVLDVLESPLLW